MKYLWDTEAKTWVPTEAVSTIQTPIWWPGKPYFDASARRTFHDKSEKRLWMKEKNVVEIGGSYARTDPLRGLAESRARGKKVFFTP